MTEWMNERTNEIMNGVMSNWIDKQKRDKQLTDWNNWLSKQKHTQTADIQPDDKTRH